ncbi:MAG TPA: PhzF family phenazine biosynthesis protein [Pyrinomonadaceae bacterium]|jgi:trans-2,3-dihydro-3-hydroxyanthranilate isomerase|nr:PhzF family phenazine biosynthesis protein [Pyrinomonadaceae bacterium]
MANYRFIQLDVFTDKSFCGNPLAVFPEAEGLTDEQMMQIAREMNLSETVFVLKPTGEETSQNDESATDEIGSKPAILRRLRIFTPTREIPFAGHPVVGTWNGLAREGIVPLPEGGSGFTRIYHEVGIGVLPVDIEFNNGQPVQVIMTQGKFEILDEIDDSQEQAELARALGLAREDVDESLPIQIITTGLTCMAVPIRSLADLRDCKVNGSLLAEIYTRHGGAGCLAFTRETIDVGAPRAHARFFAPADNIAEDPATGSACGALGAYLVYHNALNLEPEEGRYTFVIEQGDFMHRPSRINLNVKGSKGKVEEVKVGGPSVLVAEGNVMF